MMFRIVRSFILLAFVAVGVPADLAADVDQQRRDYQAALNALAARDLASFKTHFSRLDGYVLRGHLQYEYLNDRLPGTAITELQRFFGDYAHMPQALWLRQKWLHQLASRRDWKTFEAEYAEIPEDVELTCIHLARRLRTEQQAALMTQIETLWRTGRRLPGACDPAFAAWKKAGHMTTDKVWERIQLAMENRNVSVATELAVHLPSGQRHWVRLWKDMHEDPLQGLSRLRFRIDTPVARMIVRHGVVRLAQHDPQEAMQQWTRIKATQQFFGEDEDYVLRAVGILAAQRHMPEALDWLAAVSAHPDDRALHLWRVHAALRAGKWETAQRFITALPNDEQATSQLRYWSARALEQGGDKRAADEIYAALARDRDFYGFLAADRIGAEYSMQHVGVNATPDEVAALLGRSGLRVAQEFYALGRVLDARRQWNHSMKEFNNRDLEVAAAIAHDWGWYDRAVHAMALSGQSDDLELRFPLLYRDVVEANAHDQGIDAGWIYGVVRQESAFVVDARSPVGALGLMQLMPATGRATSRKLKLPLRGQQALLDVGNNVLLGVSYLKEVLGRHGGHQVLATAAYNAGPHRVTQWLPHDDALAADVWIETIPFSETRNYVKNVLAFSAIYDYRLGVRPKRLSERMPEIVRTPE